MKVLAEMVLHYGEEYLAYSLKAIDPFVDKIIIFYSSKPSQGYSTDVPCPENGDTLKNIALQASSKVDWIDVSSIPLPDEGRHRDLIYEYIEGYDVLVVLDADEVFDPITTPKAIQDCYEGDKRYYGVDGYLHFWRSFRWYNDDGFRPIRFVNLHNTHGQSEIKCTVYHFGYAQKLETIKYKFEVSGHKPEIRPDYINSIYLAWQPNGDVKFLHPASKDIWGEPRRFDRFTLPEVLHDHPNFDKDLI